ncbi:MAG: hypothetical protein Q9226_008071, partial [Calogaya cf. arnoldii]
MPRSHYDRFPKQASYPQGKVGSPRCRSTNFANSHDIHQQHTDRKKAAKAQQAEHQAQEQARIEAAALPNRYEPKLNIFIRLAEAKDLPQICVLHNYYVQSVINYETLLEELRDNTDVGRPAVRKLWMEAFASTSAVTGERVELSGREWRTRFDTCRED